MGTGAVSDLTPYDTGARAEPHRWQPRKDDHYGKVDFDAPDGTTIATVWIENVDAGQMPKIHIVPHVLPPGATIHIHLNGQDSMPAIIPIID